MKLFARVALAASVFLFPSTLMAQTFTCHAASSGTGYCQYTGKLSRVYINENDKILIYFEEPIDISLPASVGLTSVTRGEAADYRFSYGERFAEYLYSTSLTALAGDKTVVMQFSRASDRVIPNKIWIYK